MGSTYNCLPLHETLNLYVSPTAYIFEPASSAIPSHSLDNKSQTYPSEKHARESLYVDRRTGRMGLNESSDIPFSQEQVVTCYGIIGVLSLATTKAVLMTADFLIVITSRSSSCRLLSHPIYLATDFRLLPLSPLSTSSTALNHPVESELISLVEQGLKSGRLWFSYGWDLTNTLQRQKAAEGTRQPLWKRADERFFWNRYLMTSMIDITENGAVDLSRFILPIVYGFVDLRSASINNRELLFLLLSRRSRHRAGTRYFSRGIDAQGNTSNFNETEQIVLLDPLPDNGQPLRGGRVEGKERLSFVQTRGSAPLFWAEVNNLRYKPDLQVMEVPETSSALRAHLHAMINIYQRVTLVNLVNHKGHELPVKEAFERGMATLSASDPVIASAARYLYFDFHTECKNMRFDRVSVLVDRLAESLQGMGWYHALVWADHGDTVSRAYAGTGALKTDYTRTGKRSKQGQLQDGYNSVMRYIRNNFFDGDRQDAFDILTGAWVARKGGISPFTDTRPFFMRIQMPYVLAFAFTMITASFTLPRSSELSRNSYLSLWLALAFFSGSYIWGNGISYVSWPRLNPPVEILSYNGPGMRSVSRGRGLTITGMLPVRKGKGTVSGGGWKLEEVELGRLSKKKGALID
ncbi:MAG: hypothetical protein TREMPRED_002343 [Tremellales sp. Tagirdzhanova-0007]|nr:MAG: hypothetical protein TREMPRED_002343 [Tremellales sp. Tagirdzhanova-0007]